MVISREDEGSEHLAKRVTFAPVFLFYVEGLSCRFVVIANAFMTSLSSFRSLPIFVVSQKRLRLAVASCTRTSDYHSDNSDDQ